VRAVHLHPVAGRDHDRLVNAEPTQPLVQKARSRIFDEQPVTQIQRACLEVRADREQARRPEG